jgi:hypothetical protein
MVPLAPLPERPLAPLPDISANVLTQIEQAIDETKQAAETVSSNAVTLTSEYVVLWRAIRLVFERVCVGANVLVHGQPWPRPAFAEVAGRHIANPVHSSNCVAISEQNISQQAGG